MIQTGLNRPAVKSKDAKADDVHNAVTARFSHDSSRMPMYATKPIGIQPRLAVSVSGDTYEKEADRAAERVMRSPESRLLGTCACGGGCPTCKNEQAAHMRPQMQQAPTGNVGEMIVPAVVHQVLGSSGRPLDPTIRAFFEPRFGHDFGKVRVHADARAAEAAQSVGAKAFTIGQSTVFGRGQYAPETNRGKQLLAHELTHVIQQSGSRTLLQRAESDTVPACATLTDTQSDVDAKVNASLAAARAAGGTSPSGTAVAQGVENDLGDNVETGRTAIEVWASTLPPKKQSLPVKTSTKYAGVTYRLWSNPVFPILNPTMKIAGICVGSDKLGHFFQQGATFRRTEASSTTPAAEEESERSEGGGFGLATTGVFSNADLEANRQGGKFYNELIASPTMMFAIARYITSRWSEVDNPNFYEESVGRQVWANTLTGTWSGRTWAGVPFVGEAVSVTLTGTVDGKVTGRFSFVGGSSSVASPNVGTIKGAITYNTATVRGMKVPGISPNATPISGIRIEFDWALGLESGKGFLDSSGERHLTGRWGEGTSDTNRGAWNLERT